MSYASWANEQPKSLPITQEAAPLTTDPTGVVSIRGTRVTLDTVVYAFREGASAEEIACRYPSLNLPDAYAVIAYYLHHQRVVDEYLVEREREAEEVRDSNQDRFPNGGVRERLLAR